jgi:hypothetical protein
MQIVAARSVAIGTKRTSQPNHLMSAIGGKADMRERCRLAFRPLVPGGLESGALKDENGQTAKLTCAAIETGSLGLTLVES